MTIIATVSVPAIFYRATPSSDNRCSCRCIRSLQQFDRPATECSRSGRIWMLRSAGATRSGSVAPPRKTTRAELQLPRSDTEDTDRFAWREGTSLLAACFLGGLHPAFL